MTQKTTLRRATVEDAANLAAVARATFTETFGTLYSAADLATFLEQHTPGDWAREIADPAFAVLVVELGHIAVGYVKLGPPRLPFTPATGAIELRQFYLLEPWQGAGVGPRMMEWALAEARERGMASIYLSVFTDNHRARRFYRKYGFEDVGRYAFMVGDHEDEDIVMRRDL
ncbi:MAG: GNAT family N-acetyltransferase [Sphingomonas taxi]|uniref:GNAT family N-acetyltransferase n=1 Tax=Sphingomonas taxi TaxID=1549858 RepID=A0A2W5P1S1_9SPHN|nr:MAG: GNAT family N-acetyltransferase [Sphingomonas taxi]